MTRRTSSIAISVVASIAFSVSRSGWCKDRSADFQTVSTAINELSESVGNIQTAPKQDGGGLFGKVAGPKPQAVATPIERHPTPPKAPPGVPSTSGHTFRLSYATTTDPNLAPLAKVFKESDGFAEIVKSLNELFVLPADIDIVFDTCGEPNAFYASDDKRITMCYELPVYLGNRFAEDEELSKDEVGQKLVNATIFIFFHELGHALIDLYDIPVIGKEEDGVDDLATVLLVDTDADLVSDSADSFALDAEESVDDVDTFDEHSMNSQRYARIICLMYGSNPEHFSDLVGEDGLPEERTESCVAEYQQKSKTWEKLLAAHMRA